MSSGRSKRDVGQIVELIEDIEQVLDVIKQKIKNLRPGHVKELDELVEGDLEDLQEKVDDLWEAVADELVKKGYVDEEEV